VNLLCGFRGERWKAGEDMAWRREWPGEREYLKRWNRERPSTDASFAGGPSRSSCEGPVIGLEPRGRLIWEVFCEQPAGWLEGVQ
jgi:hypothetical protein